MQLKGMLYYMFVNMRYSLYIFWGVLCGVLLLSIGADFIFASEDTTIYFDFSIPIYIFAGIMGFWIVKNVIPYMIKMGSTRLNIYIGTGISFIGLTLFNALFANVIHSIISFFYGTVPSGMISVQMEHGKEESLPFTHLVDFMNANTWLNRLMVDTTISFFFITTMFFIGLIFFRYHLLGGAAFLGILVAIFIYSLSATWIVNVFSYIIDHYSMMLFYQLFGIGLIIYLISYVLLRRLTI